MKQTRLLMGMPIAIEIVDSTATEAVIDEVFAMFRTIDSVFSPYKETSEISRLNRGEIALADTSLPVQTIFLLAEQTRLETNGYFNIIRDGRYDPSGIVKGWAIQRAADLIAGSGFRNYSVDAGGDMQLAGNNQHGGPWRVGIRNPFNIHEIVKVLALTECGVATSGTSIRGDHIYNPHQPGTLVSEIVSLTVVGPNIYEADRFATAAFAMGRDGIGFIAQLEGFEAYQIDRHGRATYTGGFARYIAHDRDDR